LRDRKEDISALASYFVDRYATGVNKSGLYSEFEDKEDLFTQSLR
jgi:transcriptional regulator with PAS, ATPase and Fis domain